MKFTIDINPEQLARYEELTNQRIVQMSDIKERQKLYSNPKKLAKDLIYKEQSYNFVIAGIEANDIKDKIFDKVYKQWQKQNTETLKDC